MDYDWSPASNRPPKLYRVYRPYQHTTLSPRGLTASNPTLYLPTNPHYSLFLQSITDHRNQVAYKPTPYISFFSSKEEAESWALAAEDEFLKPAYIMEIDVGHVSMKDAVMWSVQDIMDKSGNALGLGGMRNSEWLVLKQVPGEAISRTFKSSTDVRIERGLKFPIYTENPNRPSEKDGVWDVKWFHSGYQLTEHLECGCPDKMRCIHYEWPKSMPTTEATAIGVMGLAAEEEAIVARGNQGQQTQQDQLIQQVEQPLKQATVGELQQGDRDADMDEGQPLEGCTAQGGEPRVREDNSIVGQYQSSPPTQENISRAVSTDRNREMGEKALQQPQKSLPAREEPHALARQALDVVRSLEPPAEDDLSTFGKAVEESHASHIFSLHLGGRKGNPEKPFERPE